LVWISGRETKWWNTIQATVATMAKTAAVRKSRALLPACSSTKDASSAGSTKRNETGCIRPKPSLMRPLAGVVHAVVAFRSSS
jgi:hypothetical protein